MMRFSHDKVSHYLRLVNDKNELHSTIVPGQLVVDILKKVSHNEINVFGLNGEEKIVITKKSNHTDL